MEESKSVKIKMEDIEVSPDIDVAAEQFPVPVAESLSSFLIVKLEEDTDLTG